MGFVRKRQESKETAEERRMRKRERQREKGEGEDQGAREKAEMTLKMGRIGKVEGREGGTGDKEEE